MQAPRDQAAFDRLTAGLSAERKEEVYRVLLNAGLSINDPAAVVAALIGRVGELADTIPNDIRLAGLDAAAELRDLITYAGKAGKDIAKTVVNRSIETLRADLVAQIDTVATAKAQAEARRQTALLVGVGTAFGAVMLTIGWLAGSTVDPVDRAAAAMMAANPEVLATWGACRRSGADQCAVNLYTGDHQ